MEIICDSSFLMALVSNPINCMDNVESEIGNLKLIVPDFVIQELEAVKRNRGTKRSMAAKTAIEVSNTRFEIKIMEKKSSVDMDIIDYAISNKCAVATLDNEMIRKLKKAKILVITLEKNKLTVANKYG
ncbi:MAG: PIN domain-containing protein [Nitrososphaeraceae archaeon]|jgi:rRNA-processing protein FCF1